MAKQLSLAAQAYNACLAALDDAEDRLAAAAEERNRAWTAANALWGSKGHGRRGYPRRIVIVKGEIKPG